MSSSPAGRLTGLHLLVVDDNHDAREILTMVFSYHGAVVTTASDAESALALLQRIAPDAVVCDIDLRNADGTWLLREVRAMKLSVPFIAVSGLDLDEHRLRKEGFRAYLRKPVDHELLVDTVLKVARLDR
jgi:CheY-like chemotaxis protein